MEKWFDKKHNFHKDNEINYITTEQTLTSLNEDNYKFSLWDRLKILYYDIKRKVKEWFK